MESNERGAQDAPGCPMTASEEKALLEKATLVDQKILDHPGDYYRAMRHQDPVHYDEKLGMYLVSRWEDIQTVLRDPITFSVREGYRAQYAKGFKDEFKQILKKEGGGFFEDAIMSDPPEHTRLRRLIEKAFTAHRVKQLEPGIRAIVVGLVENLAGKGKAEIIDEFALPLTSAVICEQLGLGRIPSETIQRWAHAVTQQIGRMQSREDMQKYAKDMCELQNVLIDHIRDREKTPREDMISDLVHAQLDDEAKPRLDFDEIVSLVRALVIAGNETTATALGNLFFVLATRPDIAHQLRCSVDDERLMTRFVEELLRMEPPVRGLSRMTTKDVELGGIVLPKNAHMLVMFASGNDDDEQFECPRQFDMERTNLGRHVAFGSGVHRCVGASLARMEIRVAAQEIIKRLDNIKLAVPLEEIVYQPTVATRSIAHLPLTFTRAEGGGEEGKDEPSRVF